MIMPVGLLPDWRRYARTPPFLPPGLSPDGQPGPDDEQRGLDPMSAGAGANDVPPPPPGSQAQFRTPPFLSSPKQFGTGSSADIPIPTPPPPPPVSAQPTAGPPAFQPPAQVDPRTRIEGPPAMPAQPTSGQQPMPPLDPDTQRLLDASRKPPPMHPTHGILRTVGEGLANTFAAPLIGQNAMERITDPGYHEAKRQYQTGLQTAVQAAQIRQQGEKSAVTNLDTASQARLRNIQAENYPTMQVMGALEHGAELEPDQNQGTGQSGQASTPLPVKREGSRMTIGGKPMFFPSTQQRRIEAEQAKQTDWQVITPEMADSLKDLGIQTGEKYPPAVYTKLQSIIQNQQKQPSLHYEHYTNERNGDVTQIGTDPKTGEEKTRRVFKGVALKQVPAAIQIQNQQAAGIRPEDVKFWSDQVQNDAKNWTMLQSNKSLADAVRTELSNRGVNVNQLSAQTRDTAAYAAKGLGHIAEIERAIDALDKKGQLGIATSRWNGFLNGKIGTGDPDFNVLRDNVKLTASLMARVHGGARGGSSPYMLEYMKSLVNAETMDPAILRSSIGVVKNWLQEYAKMAPGQAGVGEPHPSGTTRPPLASFERK